MNLQPAMPADHGHIRYAAELPVYPVDTIELVAELAMALLGFSGVASAFAGRERAYDLVDRMRLNAILYLSGIPLAGCLLILVLRNAGIRPEGAVVSAAVCSALILASSGVRRFPAFFRAARDPDTTTEVSLVTAVAATLTVSGGLFLHSAVSGGASWSLLGGYCLQLMIGVVVFGRLLNRAN